MVVLTLRKLLFFETEVTTGLGHVGKIPLLSPLESLLSRAIST